MRLSITLSQSSPRLLSRFPTKFDLLNSSEYYSSSPSPVFIPDINHVYSNINSEHRYFNSTMISAAAANLSSIISSGGSNGIPTQFLIGRLTASYNQSDSNSGVVATIGRAPSSIRTADGSAQTTNPSTGGPSSGAVQALGGVAFLTSLFATGIAVLAV